MADFISHNQEEQPLWCSEQVNCKMHNQMKLWVCEQQEWVSLQPGCEILRQKSQGIL